jgi:hypothetical protein
MRDTVDPGDHATHPLAAPEKLDATETLDLELARTRTRGRIFVGERIEGERLEGGIWSVWRRWCGRRRGGEGRVEGELAQRVRRRKVRVVCEGICLHGVEAERVVVVVYVWRVEGSDGIKVEH